MKRAFQATVAAIFGVLLVTSAALGGVMLTNPSVDSFGDAADEVVGTGEGQVALAGALVVTAGVAAYAAYTDDNNADDLAAADAFETKKEIYDSASIQKQNNQIIQTGYSNYLNDTETIALMEGKNAYIRALENGSTEPVARNAAIQAVADYYAQKQQNIIASWNTSAIQANSSEFTADNTTGISDTYIEMTATGGDQNEKGDIAEGPNGVANLTLVNSSTVDVVALNATGYNEYDDGAAVYSFTGQEEITFLDNAVYVSSSSYTSENKNIYLQNVVVQGPDSNYQNLSYVDISKYQSLWSDVETQNDEVQAQLDTFVNNTYDQYQQGDINASDLVDPYLGAREYGPENGSEFQTWSLRTLSAMGLNTPENLSNIGRMNVTENGVTYTGILMSDGNPSGGFTVGETYNASNLQGLQFVALDDGGQEELTGEFTLESATTASGETIQTNESVTYNNVTYETASTEEFKELQQQLDTLTAEINARQQTLRNSGGGGGWLPGFGGVGLGGLGVPVGLVAAGAAAFFVLSRS